MVDKKPKNAGRPAAPADEKSAERLPLLKDDVEYAAALADHERLDAKRDAAAERVAALEARVGAFGPVEAKTPAERAAVTKLAAEDDADAGTKKLAATLAALEPLERELAEARAELAIREQRVEGAERKLAALAPVVRERQCDAHLERVLRPLKARANEALAAALAAAREVAGAMDTAKAHFRFPYQGHETYSATAKELEGALDLIESGPKPKPEPGVVDGLLQRVTQSRETDQKAAEAHRAGHAAWLKENGVPALPGHGG